MRLVKFGKHWECLNPEFSNLEILIIGGGHQCMVLRDLADHAVNYTMISGKTGDA